MKTKIPTAIVAISVAMFAFAACGENPTPETAPPAAQQDESKPNTHADTQTPTMTDSDRFTHGRYKLTSQYGAEIEFDLPTSPDHPAVAEIEAFRQELGMPEATYIVAEVDNRNGTELVSISDLSVFDAEGIEYPFIGAEWAIDSWIPYYDETGYIDSFGEPVDEATGDAQNEKAMEIQDDLTTQVDYAAKGEVVMVFQGTELPDEFTRVAVWPHGIDAVIDAEQIQ